jgi:hypothetical protein
VKPDLAARLPAHWDADENMESEALAALAVAAREEGVPAAPAALLERFRGARFEALLAELRASALELGPDASGAEAEFEGALSRFEERQLNLQIEALKAQEGNGGLSSAGRDEFRRLIAQRAALRSPAKNPPITL